ncbi:MAG: GntR family transcriptional regulator, partial [Eubacterium sp.]
MAMRKSIKYIQISDEIKAKILAGILKPNEMLSSESQLSSEYNVSRVTIRKALMRLIDEGYLFSVPGKGTFVDYFNKNSYRIPLSLNNILKTPYDKETLIGSQIIKPDIDMVYHLQIAPKERVISIEWVLSIAGTPAVYDIKYIPFFPALPIGEIDLKYSSLPQILSSKFNLRDMQEEVTIECVCPGERACRYLEMDASKNEAVILLNKFVYDHEDNPVGWSLNYIKNDYCSLKAE